MRSLSLGSTGRADQVCLSEHFAADCPALQCFPVEGCRGRMGSPQPGDHPADVTSLILSIAQADILRFAQMEKLQQLFS